MEMTLIYTIVGFALAGYSVIANDSIQTLGTFIASKQKWFKWYTQMTQFKHWELLSRQNKNGLNGTLLLAQHHL